MAGWSPPSSDAVWTPPAEDAVHTDEEEDAAPKQTALGAAQATGSGINAGVADIAGLPVDTARNVLELGKAAAGFTWHEATGKPIPEALQPLEDRTADIGSSDWLKAQARRHLGAASVDTQENTTANRYLHAGAEVVPSALVGNEGGTAGAVRSAAAGATAGVAQQAAGEAGASPGTQAAVGFLAGAAASRATAPKAPAPEAPSADLPKTPGGFKAGAPEQPLSVGGSSTAADAARAGKPVDLSLTSSTNPGDERAAVPVSEQARRHGVLQDVGLKETRASAVTGDTKDAGTDFQTAKLDNAAGRRMNDVINSERTALQHYASDLGEGTGGSRALGEDGRFFDSTALYNRGKTMAQPVEDLTNYFNQKSKELYTEADARAPDKSVGLAGTGAFLKNERASFLATVEGKQLLEGINTRMRDLGIMDGNGNVQMGTAAQAERLKQFANDAWTPRTSRLIRQFHDSIDDDVLQHAGEDIYAKGRQIRALRSKLLDNPDGISALAPPPKGSINRATAFGDVANHVTGLDYDQFRHLVDVYRNAPPEVAGSAAAGLNEIRAHFANQMEMAGNSTQSMWNAKGVSKFLAENGHKMGEVFSPEEMQRFHKLADAGEILRMDRSYPGAAAQQYNLAGRGVLTAGKVAGTGAGAIMGTALHGLEGGAAGHGVGMVIQKGANAVADRMLKAQIEKRIHNLSGPAPGASADDAASAASAGTAMGVAASDQSRNNKPLGAIIRGGRERGSILLNDIKKPEPSRPTPPVRLAASPQGVSAYSANGATHAVWRGNDLHITGSDTAKDARGGGEGNARLVTLADHAHSKGGKMFSGDEVSEPEQRRYTGPTGLASKGYDVKTNTHTTDQGTGVKKSTSELKGVYEVGPKKPLGQIVPKQGGWIGNKETQDKTFWHGTPTGDLRGGETGLHLGTFKAARDALKARIGWPADGRPWDGTREYGKTLLAGQDTLNKMGRYNITGHNVDAPKHDYYISEHPRPPTYGNGEKIPWDVKPSIHPYELTGDMTNTRNTPHGDWKANGYMKGALKRGNAKNGYYYENVSEDPGSVSAVVPNGGHVQPLGGRIPGQRGSVRVMNEEPPEEGGGSMLNVGLHQGTQGEPGFRKMSKQEVHKAIESTGAKVTRSTVLTPERHGVSEPTLVVSTDRPLSDEEMNSVLAKTKQSAIPQRTDKGDTSMHIARGHEQVAAQEGWDQFNPQYFRKHNGSTMGPQREDHPDWIPQRQVTSKKAAPLGPDERPKVDLDTFKSTPALFEKNMDAVRDYPNVTEEQSKKPASELADDFIKHAKENILSLHDAVPEDTRERSSKWYDGANKIAKDFSEQHGIKDSQSAGVLASLSPQKDWYQNVSLAERVLDIHKGKGEEFYNNHKFDDKMESALASRPNLNKPEYQGVIDLLRGKSLGDLGKHPDLTPEARNTAKALWTRLYDEAHNDRGYKIVTPEGEHGDFVKKADGSNANVGWGSLGEIGKAIKVIESDGSSGAISPLMGDMHKVRNFYNNILSPNSMHDDVTMDTHAVAGALMRPLSGKSTEVAHNFSSSLGKGMKGAGGSAITGIQGTYPLYAEAYRQAAKERGILPRQMQSIVWEAVRGLFPESSKTAANAKAVEGIWNEYRAGKITQDQARSKIYEQAGGIRPPTWEGTSGPDEGGGGKANAK